VLGFTTSMTGEFYALLRQHSILARTMPKEDATLHGDAFDAGVAHAIASTGLLQSAFSVRTLALFDRMPESHRSSYLSGIVIGEELRSRMLTLLDETADAGERVEPNDSKQGSQGPAKFGGEHANTNAVDHVVVIGDGALTERYRRALSLCGVSAVAIGAQAAWRGLRQVAMRVES
jgi:2-dehydro-3-deoxygalactonokinase